MAAIKVITFAVLALSCFLTTEACSCIPRHELPKNVGCKNEYMVILHVNGVKSDEMSSDYKVSVLYDNTPSLATPMSFSKAKHLRTASSSAACGVYLQNGSTYLVKGRLSGNDATNLELHAQLCTTYAKMLPHVPSAEEAKELFSALYKSEC